jgi:hypothetical protein
VTSDRRRKEGENLVSGFGPDRITRIMCICCTVLYRYCTENSGEGDFFCHLKLGTLDVRKFSICQNSARGGDLVKKDAERCFRLQRDS